MRRYIPQIGKYVTFEDGTTEDEIRRQIDEYLGKPKDDGIDALDALKSGWSSGWADAKDSAADYADLVGLDERAAGIREGIARDQKDQFVPEGFVEKLLAGLGAAPGSVVGMAPGVIAGVGVTAATANPFLGAAAGFGLHGAVRGGDGDLTSMGALKEGLIGAAEGAAFGGLGKLGRLGRGAAMAGIGAGGGAARSIVEGEDLNAEDMAAQAATLGLLGLVHGKGKKPTVADAEAGVNRAIGTKAREAAVAEWAKDTGIPGVKPPKFPFNLELLPPKSREWVIEKYKTGEVTHPERMSQMDMRKVALKNGRPDIARELVLSKGELAGQELLVMEEFRSASTEAQTLKQKIGEANSKGDSAAAQMFQQQYDDMAQDVMALAALDQGYGTEVARALSARNAMRYDLPVSEQAILYLQKKKALDVESFNKVMSAATDDEIRAITKTAWEPTLGDKAYEMWMMSMLSNPITFGPTGVNTISNLAKDTLLKYPVKAVQAIVEPYRAKKAGRAVEYDFKTLADDFKVDLAESGPALRRWLHDIRQDKTIESGKLELTHGVSIGGQSGASGFEKGLGKFVRTPGRFLEATDQFFRGKAESAEALRLATEKIGRGPGWDQRRALAKKMIDNPKEFREEFVRIKNAGNEAVFTQSLRQQSEHSAIAKLANVAQNLKQNKNPLISVPAKIIVPFTRTPANIAIDSLKHSPFGIKEFHRLKALSKKQELIRKAGGKSKDSMVLERDLSEQIAKSVVGTTMMSWAFYEALNGNVTGGGPVDYNQYQKWLEAGNQPYSMRMGDKWVSYQRIEPFASLLGFAADAADTMHAPPDEVFDRALAAVKDNIANKTFLLGVENLAKAWANPKRYGTSMAKSIASTVVPAGAMLGAAARWDDPVQRVTTGENFVDSIGKSIQNRIPIARKQLEPKYSVTGHPVVDEYAIPNAGSPFRIADTAPVTAVDAEIDRLGRAGFDVPNMQRRQRIIPGERRPVAATAEEFSTFNEYNNRASAALEPIITGPSWNKLPPELQSKIIMDIFRKYSKYASGIVRHKMVQNRK